MKKLLLGIFIGAVVVLVGTNVYMKGTDVSADSYAYVDDGKNTNSDQMTEKMETARESDSENYSYLDEQILPDEREHIEACIETLKEELSESENVPHEYVCRETTVEVIDSYFDDDGHGIGFCWHSGGYDASGFAYAIVLRTEDAGETWAVNPEILRLDRGSVDTYYNHPYIVLSEYCDKSETARFHVSYDGGETFEEVTFKEMGEKYQEETAFWNK